MSLWINIVFCVYTSISILILLLFNIAQCQIIPIVAEYLRIMCSSWTLTETSLSKSKSWMGVTVNLKCVYSIISFILLINNFTSSSVSILSCLQSFRASCSLGGPIWRKDLINSDNAMLHQLSDKGQLAFLLTVSTIFDSEFSRRHQCSSQS